MWSVAWGISNSKEKEDRGPNVQSFLTQPKIEWNLNELWQPKSSDTDYKSIKMMINKWNKYRILMISGGRDLQIS